MFGFAAHGEDDPRVPFRNATELRAALQAAGKLYQWLAEPHELHGFVSGQHNEQLFTMIIAFLAKCIGPGGGGQVVRSRISASHEVARNVYTAPPNLGHVALVYRFIQRILHSPFGAF